MGRGKGFYVSTIQSQSFSELLILGVNFTVVSQFCFVFFSSLGGTGGLELTEGGYAPSAGLFGSDDSYSSSLGSG